MPFWNETDSGSTGLPTIFTDTTYSFSDGTGSVPNPLYSYKLQEAISDSSDNQPYAKPVGYETVRYPWSGLVSGDFVAQTKAHNAELQKQPPEAVTKMLNDNVRTWLTEKTYINSDNQRINAGKIDNFNACPKAPKYMLFFNTTSVNKWNKDHPSSKDPLVVSLEEPHSGLHLAIGGFDIPRQANRSAYEFANGDMGDNETAGYDPVFYFIHCFIDYIFWKWQVLHSQTTDLVIEDPDYPGVEGLSLESKLDPFTVTVDGQTRPMIGQVCRHSQ